MDIQELCKNCVTQTNQEKVREMSASLLRETNEVSWFSGSEGLEQEVPRGSDPWWF